MDADTTESYPELLIGAAQELGDGRYGVVVEVDGVGHYVEHAVAADGLTAEVWRGEELVASRRMPWSEVVERMFTNWSVPPRD